MEFQPEAPLVPVVHCETEVPPPAPLVPVVHRETEVPAPAPLVTVVQIETTVTTLPPSVPLQKEMLVSTTTNDAPKTPDLTACADPLRTVQKYKAYFRIEIQRFREGLRPKPPTFEATISAVWLEPFLLGGCYKKATGEKWTYEEIDDEELFKMYLSRCKKREPKRPSTFLRESQVA